MHEAIENFPNLMLYTFLDIWAAGEAKTMREPRSTRPDAELELVGLGRPGQQTK